MSEFSIKSGSSGDIANVNSEKQLSTTAVIQSELEHESEENGQAFVWRSVPYSLTGGDTVIAVKNTSSDKALHITRVNIYCGATPSRFDVHLVVVAYTSAGSAIVVEPINTILAKVADAEAFGDETGNVQGNIIESPYLAADDKCPLLMDGVILRRNTAIAVDMAETATEFSISVWGHYED